MNLQIKAQKHRKRSALFTLLIMVLCQIILLFTPIQTAEAAKFEDIKNAGHTFKKEWIEMLIKECRTHRVLPELCITQLFLETHWGDNAKYFHQDNNMSGVKYPGAKCPGVKITEGSSVTELGHTSSYAKYETINDYFKDYVYLLREGNNYNVAGKATLSEAAKGLFISGGAKYNYAESYDGYVANLQAISKSINSQNDNILKKINEEVIKDGKWEKGDAISTEPNQAEEEHPELEAIGVLTDFFIVNGYGAETKRDWDEAEVKAPSQGQYNEDFTIKQKQDLENWLNEYKNAKTLTFIGLVRTAIQTFGLVLIFYAIAIIFGYLFDRVGVFDFSVLYMITGGKLGTVFDSKDETFFSKEAKNQATKFVSLKGISMIVLIMLTIAVLVFTGQIFRFGFYVVQAVEKCYTWIRSF